MSQAPPPPPPAAGPPPPAGARPPLVTAAAVVLFVAAGLGIVLVAIPLLSIGGGLAVGYALVAFIVAAAQIYAGTQILAGREQGRMLGIILAAIGAVFALLSIGQAGGGVIVPLLIDGFIIYALVTTAAWFKR